MTLALDDSHDLYMSGLSRIAVATGGDAVVQGIKTRLLLFRGEWYLDAREGTPWFDEVFDGARDASRIEKAIKGQILATPNVIGISSFTLNLDRETRSLSVTFEADTTFGPTGTIEVAP